MEELEIMRSQEVFDKVRAKKLATILFECIWHVILAPLCMGAKTLPAVTRINPGHIIVASGTLGGGLN